MNTPLKNILDLLKLFDYKDKSEVIDIAKGKYELPQFFKEIKKSVIRRKKLN